ncbi:hypothetical protein ACQP3F_31790, partial [Escherichia coli]
ANHTINADNFIPSEEYQKGLHKRTTSTDRRPLFNVTTVTMTIVVSHKTLRGLKCRKFKWVAGSLGRNASRDKALGKKC